MNQPIHQDTAEEKTYYKAVIKALEKFNEAERPFWIKFQRAIARAWGEYEKDIAPFEKVCDRELTRAARAFVGATKNK